MTRAHSMTRVGLEPSGTAIGAPYRYFVEQLHCFMQRVAAQHKAISISLPAGLGSETVKVLTHSKIPVLVYR